MQRIKVICPNPECDASYSVAVEKLGKKARCKRCGRVFRLTDDVPAGPFEGPPSDVIRQYGLPLRGEETAGPVGSPLSDVPGAAAPSGGGPAVVPSLPEQFGRYRILQNLGIGGMASVYLAFDSQVGREVALKVPDFRLQELPEARERFLREAQAAGRLSQLDNPTICLVYDSGEVGGILYLTMQYIKGQTLSDRLRKERAERRPMDVRRACEWVRTLAHAMDEAHGCMVIHRDLKPSNIMITDRHERLKIVDFGIARLVGEKTLSAHGDLIGTPAYMAPEQVRGAIEQMGPHTDVYALGVIFYEMLTSERPFQAKENPNAILHMILHDQPVPPSRRRPGLPREIDRICLKAMAKEPRERYPAMAGFAAAIDRYLQREERARNPDLDQEGWLRRFFGRGAKPPAPTPEPAPDSEPAPEPEPEPPPPQRSTLMPEGPVNPAVPLTVPESAPAAGKAAEYLASGNARRARGDLQGAIQNYGEAIRLDPGNAGAFNNRGLARRAGGDLGGAIADFAEAIRLDPKEPRPRNNRGLAYQEKGQYAAALADFGEAIYLDPRYADAHANRVRLLATCPESRLRNPRLAVEAATRACEQTGWTDPGLLSALAVACAEAGDFPSAVRWQQKALERLVPATPGHDAALARLELFRSRHTAREAGR